MVATFAALLSHVAAGGAMPGPAGIAVPWVLSLAVCTMLAGRRVSLARLTVAIPLSQLLFHALFAVGAGTLPTGAPHAHHTLFVIDGASLVPADPAMWGGHALAAAVTIAVLHRGERTLVALGALALRLGARLGARLGRSVSLTPAAVGFAARPRVRPVSAVPLLHSRVTAGAVSRRGPPLLSVV